MPAVEESNFVTWAREEIRRAGLFDEDSDYDGLLGEQVMRVVETFSGAGHSGMSAAMTAAIFQRLSEWKPLTPLTQDPSEWMQLDDEVWGGPVATWQSRRSPSCFSEDGGRTYYSIDEPLSWWRRLGLRLYRGRRWEKRHTALAVEGGI